MNAAFYILKKGAHKIRITRDGNIEAFLKDGYQIVKPVKEEKSQEAPKQSDPISK